MYRTHYLFQWQEFGQIQKFLRLRLKTNHDPLLIHK